MNITLGTRGPEDWTDILAAPLVIDGRLPGQRLPCQRIITPQAKLGENRDGGHLAIERVEMKTVNLNREGEGKIVQNGI